MLYSKLNKDRKSAAEALGEIGSEAALAVPALIKALKDGDMDVRSYAAWALGRIGPKAKPAVDDLIQLLDDEDSEVRKYTAEAIRKINSKIEAETTDETSFDF